MDSFNEIMRIWQTADVAGLPSASEVSRSSRKYRLGQIFKSLCTMLFALFLMAGMVWVVFAYKSAMLSTRIGEACFIIALLILIRFSSRYLRRISMQKGTSNSAFLLFLKEEEQRQIRFYKTTQVIGFVLSSVGLLFYLFEFVYSHPNLTIILYLPALLWILGCWTLLRPWAMKRRTRKLQETIQQLETLSGQLNNS